MTERPRLTWWQRRLDELTSLIERGEYFVPAEDVAHAILFGRPKWGDDPIGIDSSGDKVTVKGSQ